MRIITLFFFFSLLTTLAIGQTRCDTTDSGIFIITEVLPTPNITYGQLENLLNTSIDINEYTRPDRNWIYLSFIINCNGEDFDYEIYGPIDKKLQDKLIQIIKSNVSWTPAKQRGENVDFQKNFPIKIEGNQFKILDQENKNQKKKKKKKK